MAKVEHFEIPADDVERAAAFYAKVFDFEYQAWSPEMGIIGNRDGEGISGDIHQRDVVAHPTVVFTVDRIEDTVALVISNGGEQIGEIQPLDERSRWVYVRDSEGNAIGLFDKNPA